MRALVQTLSKVLVVLVMPVTLDQLVKLTSTIVSLTPVKIVDLVQT